VREWLKENWPRWVEERPEWFTPVFISNVDDVLLPPEFLLQQNQIGSRLAAQEFPWRQDGQRAQKKHRSSISRSKLNTAYVNKHVFYGSCKRCGAGNRRWPATERSALRVDRSLKFSGMFSRAAERWGSGRNAKDDRRVNALFASKLS